MPLPMNRRLPISGFVRPWAASSTTWSSVGVRLSHPVAGRLRVPWRGAVLVEAHDEWQVGERRYLSEGSMTLLAKQGRNSGGGSHTRIAHGIVRTAPLASTR